MTLADHENHEDERMERNAWRVADDIALLIDDAPVLSDYIIKGICNRMEEEAVLFYNRTQLHDYRKASESSKKRLQV